MKNRMPVLMKPYLKDAIWGGTKLIKNYGKVGESLTLAESWEISDFPGCNSYAASGEHEGSSFARLHAEFAGDKKSVLIKLIDSDADLSIQVHPSVAYQSALPKNECWYILDAEKDARIAYGLREDMSPSELVASVNDGAIEEKLNYVGVKPGDFYYVPAGLIHAIGKGITLIEIQQTSDTTYRLYDYGRRDSAGNLRELHLEKAADAFKHFSADEIMNARYGNADCDKEPNCLCDNEFFAVYRIEDETLSVKNDEFECSVTFFSDGEISCGEKSIKTAFGETYYIPPMCECSIFAKSAVLTKF